MFENLADFIRDGRGAAQGDKIDIDLENAVESEGIMVINIPHSLAALTKTAGKLYYFYLEISNNDRTATDTKNVTVRSEIATISFSNPGSPLIPRIDSQPASAAYRFGRSLAVLNLTVRAGTADDGNLTYQWYFNATGSLETANLTAIPGATEASYGPAVELLVPGKNYFFVRVTNGTASVLSIPAILEMSAGQTALDPVIEVQPKDGIYFTGEAVKPLTIQTERAMDGGTISVQWFSNTRQEARNGTRITGATGTSYTPTVTASGNHYFYAIVTNTNQGVISNVKTATTASRAAKIVITTPSVPPTTHVTVTVADPRRASNRFQYVRGYGGMDVAWANFPEQTPEDMELMYNPDWGLGYNINRIMIPPSNTNVNITMRDITNAHRPHYYENVRIVNKYGGYVSAAPWSPPKEWKSNNSINGGGHLVRSYYQQYANYLRAFAKHMYDAGAPIHSISIQNEPNYVAGYDGCEWTPEQMRDFFKTVGRFTTGIRGFGGGKEIPSVWTLNGESANTPFINIPALVDPASRDVIDLYARHVYGSTTDTLWRIRPDGSPVPPSELNNSSTLNNILSRPDGTKYEVWMTEHNINSANATAYPNDSTWNYVWRFMNDIDLVMRLNNENAFIWWASKRFYSMVGDGQFNTRDGAPLPRGYGLSHYAKYSIDTHRVGVTVSGRMADGTNITDTDRLASPVNNTNFNLDNNTPRITAYAMIESGRDNQPIKPWNPDTDSADWSDVSSLSLILMTPTSTAGTGGRNMGNIRINMPAGFIIGGVSAHKSTSAINIFMLENIGVNEERTAAFITNFGPGQIISLRLTRQQ